MSATRATATKTVRNRVKRAFAKRLGITQVAAGGLMGQSMLQDKLYELQALLETMDRLPGSAANTFHLVAGSSLKLRYKGGRIDRSRWPHVEMRVHGHASAEIWSNIEFVSLSAHAAGRLPGHPTYADTHELDIVVTELGLPDGYLEHDRIELGVEVKDRPYSKELLKALLGVRREMAYVGGGRSRFAWWPAAGPGASPPSALVAFASGHEIANYVGPEDHFGLKLIHLP